MSTVLRRPGRMAMPRARAEPVEAARTDPRYQAYTMMRIGFAALPVVMGVDKFFNVLTQWPQYLADWIDELLPGTAQQLMYVVGGIEIAAGLLVALRPRLGAYVVAAWLAGIIVNLVSYGEWYDVAVRDGGLMLGAIALGRLASVYDRRA